MLGLTWLSHRISLTQIKLVVVGLLGGLVLVLGRLLLRLSLLALELLLVVFGACFGRILVLYLRTGRLV